MDKRTKPQDAERREMNFAALERISAYLNRCPRAIEEAEVAEVMDCGVSQEEAVLMLLCAVCGLDETRSGQERTLIRQYFRPSLRRLDAQAYRFNPYMQTIRFPEAEEGRWRLTQLSYEPYELFVRDDLLLEADGREIPRLGYFDERFDYPAVLEDGREWMTVTPNEIETMKDAIARAHGRTAAMGLGLGYFAFMASEKPEVESVTVIERDETIIRLFEKQLLPQFPYREKIRIVCADAFDYARTRLGGTADFVFVDLWHDVSDGAEMYLRMKLLERHAPQAEFAYWIETSIRAFLRSIA